jgi:CHAD domain-containing protein
MSRRGAATIGVGLIAAAERPLMQFGENLPKTVGAEAYDGIHDARVALRRLGALLRGFEPVLPARTVSTIRREIRWMRRALGPARDLDVFIHETGPELGQIFGAETGLRALLDVARARRAPLAAALEKTVASRRCKNFAALLNRVFGPDGANGVRRRRGGNPDGLNIESPFAPFARAELRRRYKKLRKGAQRIEKLEEAELHRMRIRLRNFRYVCDGFSMLLPEGRYLALRSAMTKLQDHMGALNDAVTAPLLVADLAAHADHGLDAADLARAVGVVAGWGAARRQVLRATLDEPWRRMIKRADRMFAGMKD